MSENLGRETMASQTKDLKEKTNLFAKPIENIDLAARIGPRESQLHSVFFSDAFKLRIWEPREGAPNGIGHMGIKLIRAY